MASLKEIAKLAQVSQGTVSFVLNGRGDEFRISAETQKRIFEVAKSLGYNPNISARRLRSGGNAVSPVICLFWMLDTRTSMMGRFLKGIQDAISPLEVEYEIQIQPFKRLSDVQSLVTGTRFNGAIIANATEEDEYFLEQADIKVPIVLYQRSSKKHSFVNADNFKTGTEVARLFENRGHSEVAIIVPNVSSSAVRLRMEGFLYEAQQLDLKIPQERIVYSEISEEGGYQAVQQLFKFNHLPTAVFVLNDQMSVGALMALNERGISVPNDMELVSHDDYEVARFTIPPLTTMHLPVEEMAKSCVQILLDLMHHQVNVPVKKDFETHLIVRKSCGDFI
ncbi:LacI family DNA-binding transcriptional regulator [Neobacillus drentensis]|uniref:LacI family DNA-binding transcriptional regulator n=1 Tax=Neobacillus drentensis TaxID=220684 RepID=UPI002FFEFDB9